MQTSIKDWTNWLLAQGKSSTTVRGYQWELRRLAKALGEVAPAAVRAADLTRALAERRLAGVSEATMKRSIAAYRSFFGYICGRKSPAAGLKFPTVRRRRQRTLDDDQAMSVLAVCDTSTARGVRDLGLLTLLLDTGLRASEVCRLKLADVDFERRVLSVRIKGGDEAQAVFSASTGQYLTQWLGHRARLAQAGTETLFCAVGGSRKIKGAPLTADGLRAIFRDLGKRAGLLKGFSPHDLRRTFATLATRRGAPSRVVQVAGRWSNLAMVERYTGAISAADFEPYSPVEGLLRIGPGLGIGQPGA